MSWTSSNCSKAHHRCYVDWAHIIALKISINSGDDIAGIVYSIGSNVNASGEFSKGDRVAAFHPMLTPHGAYAEYAVAPAHTVFLIPQHVGFEGEQLFQLGHIYSPLTLPAARSSDDPTCLHDRSNIALPPSESAATVVPPIFQSWSSTARNLWRIFRPGMLCDQACEGCQHPPYYCHLWRKLRICIFTARC